jgi:hypothetical protein
LAVAVWVAAGQDSGGGTAAPAPESGAQHPALVPFGVTAEGLPAELYLVRTRGELPHVSGITVHGVRDGSYLVSGAHEAVRELRRERCAVIPIEGVPAAPRFTPRQWTTITSPDPAVAAMVDQVNWNDIRAKMQWLVDFQTRYTIASNHQQVAEAIGDAFTDIGLTPELLPFECFYRTAWNVVATQTGTVYPDSFFIICGHFDSYSGWPDLFAPGADDNASGTAAVLTAAEILVNHDFEYSIKYICFSGEEQGLVGSEDYATWAEQNNIGIVGVLNFDMIGYWEEGVEMDLEIETNHASQWLAAAILNAADLYVGAPYELHVDDGAWWGDHASFWDHGFAAVNHEEAWDWGDPDFNPYYHTVRDTMGYIGDVFTTGNVKIGVAALATLARPDTTATGVGTPVPPPAPASITAYPNPFGDRVTFTVTGLPDRDEVRVIVYDVRGRRVGGVPVRLHDGRGAADWRLSEDDRNELRSGVYFGKLQGPAGAATVKIVHIR